MEIERNVRTNTPSMDIEVNPVASLRLSIQRLSPSSEIPRQHDVLHRTIIIASLHQR